jgi:hypothetical protein
MTASFREIVATARSRIAAGETKDAVYADLVPQVSKPKRLAGAIANMPNHDVPKRYVRLGHLLAVLVAVEGALSFFGLAGLLWDEAPATVILVIGLIFLALFGGIAIAIWRQTRGSNYTAYIFLLFIGLIQTPRAVMSGTLDLTSAAIGAGIAIALIAFTMHVRNNVFSRTGAFGAVLKTPGGGYDFSSPWQAGEPPAQVTAA